MKYFKSCRCHSTYLQVQMRLWEHFKPSILKIQMTQKLLLRGMISCSGKPLLDLSIFPHSFLHALCAKFLVVVSTNLQSFQQSCVQSRIMESFFVCVAWCKFNFCLDNWYILSYKHSFQGLCVFDLSKFENFRRQLIVVVCYSNVLKLFEKYNCGISFKNRFIARLCLAQVG